MEANAPIKLPQRQINKSKVDKFLLEKFGEDGIKELELYLEKNKHISAIGKNYIRAGNYLETAAPLNPKYLKIMVEGLLLPTPTAPWMVKQVEANPELISPRLFAKMKSYNTATVQQACITGVFDRLMKKVMYSFLAAHPEIVEIMKKEAGLLDTQE